MNGERQLERVAALLESTRGLVRSSRQEISMGRESVGATAEAVLSSYEIIQKIDRTMASWWFKPEPPRPNSE